MTTHVTDEADRGLFEQVVQVAADAILTEDLDGRITSWNAAAERLYGVSARASIGRLVTDVLSAETAADLRTLREQATAGRRVERQETWHRDSSGLAVSVCVSVSSLKDRLGHVTGFVTSVEDTSLRVRLDAELEDAHRTLQKHHEALQRSNRDLEQFAYVASHDLSEPLRVITGYVQLLEKRYGQHLDERGHRYVAHVVDGASRMRTLIDDLLEYSRFLRAPASDDRVDLTRLAERTAAELDPVAVEVCPLPDVWGDEGSVSALLHNLVGNALKFSRDGVPSKVVLSAGTSDGRVVLRVDDNGIGIEPEYRERVFRMFQRLHVREDYPGTGIGLAIVQQVAENHGGRVWVEESPLGGCRFSVTLPAARSSRRDVEEGMS